MPTHAFELIEFAAARQGRSRDASKHADRCVGRSDEPCVQHAMTLATGPGFDGDELRDEVRHAAGRTKQMTAYVRAASKRSGKVARWQGGRMPLSSELAENVQRLLAAASHGDYSHPEMQRVRPILDLQQRWSALPVPGQLLIEQLRSREGSHLFVYPFAGRVVNEGIAALVAYRWVQRKPATFPVTANDYGVELLMSARLQPEERLLRRLLSPANLASDLLASLNVSRRLVSSGHVHPVVRMRSRRERMRLPAFWFTPQFGVLPSFGSFTGGAEIEPGPRDEVFAVAAGRVWRVPNLL